MTIFASLFIEYWLKLSFSSTISMPCIYYQSINPFIIIERCTQKIVFMKEKEKKTPTKRNSEKQIENERRKKKIK